VACALDDQLHADRRREVKHEVRVSHEWLDDRRVIAGRIASGRVEVGDEVQVWPSGHRARVSSLETWPPTDSPPTVLTARDTVALTLDYPLFIQRGDFLTDPANRPRLSGFIAANIFWLGRTPLSMNREYKLKLVTSERTAEVFSIARVMNAASMHVEHGKSFMNQNEAGEVVFRTMRPLVFDPAADVPETGRFVILDGPGFLAVLGIGVGIGLLLPRFTAWCERLLDGWTEKPSHTLDDLERICRSHRRPT